MLKYNKYDVVFQECPNEISLVFEITNCPHKCPECHSPHLQKNEGTPLTIYEFSSVLNKYEKYISAVLFFGGDQEVFELIDLLRICEAKNLKTGLWTGATEVPKIILSHLTYLKTGKYDSKFGGLDKETTNQQYVNLKTGQQIFLRSKELSSTNSK